MRVRVLTFASASDAVGASEIEIEVEPPCRVSNLKSLLEERYPDLVPLWPRLAVAVDGEIADDDQVLADGNEVALLPPVSGGSGAASDSAAVRLVDGPLETDTLLAHVAAPSRGAVLMFFGAVRDHHAGRAVTHITYSAYRPMAASRLRRIVDELQSGDDQDLRVAIHHRLGKIPVGEASVAIAVASPHREAAYTASRRALERLKAEVPIWKREHYRDGEAAWREEESLVPASLSRPG